MVPFPHPVNSRNRVQTKRNESEMDFFTGTMGNLAPLTV
jgi:hypothetical protein